MDRFWRALIVTIWVFVNCINAAQHWQPLTPFKTPVSPVNYFAALLRVFPDTMDKKMLFGADVLSFQVSTQQEICRHFEHLSKHLMITCDFDDCGQKQVIKIAICDNKFKGPILLHYLSVFEALRELYVLANDRIPLLDVGDWSQCLSLQTFYIEYNKILTFQWKSLAQCQHLTYLSLDGNGFSTIQWTPIMKCSALQKIGLAFNELTSIDLSWLCGMLELKTVSLSHNHLETLDLRPLMEKWCFPQLPSIFVSANFELMEESIFGVQDYRTRGGQITYTKLSKPYKRPSGQALKLPPIHTTSFLTQHR